MPKETTKPSIHSGHRSRMKQRFMQNGGRDFSDHELLEMLLFYVIPRADTNELAHALLHEFGSLRDVISADPARIRAVVGAGRSTATFLSLLFTIRKRIDTQKYTKTKFVADSLSKVGNFFVDYFKDIKSEEICVMLLDGSLRLIECRTLTNGSANSAPLDIRALVKLSIIDGASHVVLAHNHPSGPSAASAEDKQLTANIESALDAVGISLLEHLIVNEVGYKPTMQMRIFTNPKNEHTALYKKFYE